MDNRDADIPGNDHEVEFVDLDNNIRSHTPYQFHLSPRARIWTAIATTGSIVLLFALIFGNQLQSFLASNQFYLLTHKPLSSKISMANPDPVSLQHVINGIVYAVNPDLMVYAIRASNGSLVQQGFYMDSGWPTSDNAVTYTTTIRGMITATKNTIPIWQRRLPSPAAWPLTVVNTHISIITQDNILYELSATDGAVLWHYQLPARASQAVVAAGGVLYISSDNGALEALSASKGTLLWHAQIAPSAQLLATADSIIYASDNSVNALRASNGSLLWKLQITSRPVQPLILAAGNLYIATFDGSIDAFKASNATLLWHHQLPSLAYEAIIISANIVYIHTSDNAMYTLNATYGMELWSRPVANVLSFAVMDQMAYVVTLDNELEALPGAYDAILWQRQLPSSAMRPLIVTNGVIYSGSKSGTVYAVRASDSTLLWHYATQLQP